MSLKRERRVVIVVVAAVAADVVGVALFAEAALSDCEISTTGGGAAAVAVGASP